MTNRADDPTLDPPIPDDLSPAFDLTFTEDVPEDLVTLHGAIVARLRREAAGLPMNTTQTLLLERIAHNYIVLRMKERSGGFTTPAQQKDFNTFWLSMTQEFNRLLMNNQDKMREALLLEISSIVMGGLDMIHDAEDRKALRRHFQAEFAAIDV